MRIDSYGKDVYDSLFSRTFSLIGSREGFEAYVVGNFDTSIVYAIGFFIGSISSVGRDSSHERYASYRWSFRRSLVEYTDISVICLC